MAARGTRGYTGMSFSERKLIFNTSYILFFMGERPHLRGRQLLL